MFNQKYQTVVTVELINMKENYKDIKILIDNCKFTGN